MEQNTYFLGPHLYWNTAICRLCSGTAPRLYPNSAACKSACGCENYRNSDWRYLKKGVNIWNKKNEYRLPRWSESWRFWLFLLLILAILKIQCRSRYPQKMKKTAILRLTNTKRKNKRLSFLNLLTIHSRAKTPCHQGRRRSILPKRTQTHFLSLASFSAFVSRSFEAFASRS